MNFHFESSFFFMKERIDKGLAANLTQIMLRARWLGTGSAERP